MSESGTRGAFDRWLPEPSEDGGQRPSAPERLASRVLGMLPVGTPGFYHALAEIVIDAWADHDLREHLRRDPAAAIAKRGLEIPANITFDIVSPYEATLPEGTRVGLPLPPANDPVTTTALARAGLADTAWGWLLNAPVESMDADEDPLAAGSAFAVAAARVQEREQARAHQDHAARSTNKHTPWFDRFRRTPRPVFTLVGAFGAVVLLIWSANSGGILSGDSTSGTASGTLSWTWTAIYLAAFGAAWWWMAGRKG